MKILGRGDEKFIVEVTRREMANLCGYYYEGAANCPEFKVGNELKISEMFDQMYYFSIHKVGIREQIALIREYADKLELIEPIKMEHKP
jgi:hypothetical protein